jgi:hypothetical protein
MAGELFTRLWQESEERNRRRDALEGRGGSAGAGAGGAILFLPFYGPFVAFFLYPLTLVGIAVTEFLCNQARYADGALPGEPSPAWQTVLMFAAGYACFRVDDRLGLTQPYYFIRHCYRIGLAVVLFIVAGARQFTGTAWPGVLELFTEPGQLLFMFVALSVYAVVGNRLLRSDGLRSVWNFVLKTWHIRPQNFPVLYKRGDPAFTPFAFRRPRREHQKPKDIVDQVLSQYVDLDTGRPRRAQGPHGARDEAQEQRRR